MQTADAEFTAGNGLYPMTERQSVIRDSLLAVREKIENAVERRGTGIHVTLLAATKTVPADEIVYAAQELSLRIAGENRVQEFSEKFDTVTPYLDGYHFIGHLQTNKVRSIVGRCPLIHSVSSIRLLTEIDRVACRLGITQDVLLELNCAREATKSGFLSEELQEALDFSEKLAGVRVRGLMTMGPAGAEKEVTRKFFRETYSIFIDNFGKKTHNIDECILSMGMSDSFETAIEEGATLVRVGSAIFGKRSYP